MTAVRRSGGQAVGVAFAVCILASSPVLRLAAQDSLPSKPPAPAPLAPVRFPPFAESTLPNGMRLLVVESHAQPVLSVTLSFPAGDVTDPAGKEGLATLAAQVLTKGAGARTGDQISSAIEGVGGSLSATSGDDFFTAGFDVLRDHAELAFSLLADVVRRPTFPADEVDLARTQAISGLRLDLSQPSAIAARTFAHEIYGNNPYGRHATEASYGAITRADVTGFAAAHLRPSGALLVMAGDVTPAQARAFALKAFGDWRGVPAPARPMPPPPVKSRTEIVLVHRPGSVQSNIVLGNTTYPPTDSGYYAARVATQALGGGADSRLFLILREQKSWTYGSYAALDRHRGVGDWQATFEGRTEVTDSALREMLHQVDRMRTEPLADSELANTKGFLIGSFPLSIQTPGQIAGAVANAKLLGLGNDYVQRYRDRLAAVSAARAMAAAARTYHRRGLTIVVVGDATQLYDKLLAIAPVRLLNVDGKPITPADLHPTASTLHFDPSQIVSRSDSFQFVVQGKPLGTQLSSIRRSADSLVYQETLTLPMGLGSQQTTVVFDPITLSVRQVDQTGTVRGQASAIHLTYGGGRAKGTASIPQPPPATAPRSITIDTAVSATTYDDNALRVLMPALPLAVGASFNIQTFSAGDGATRLITLKVAAQDTIAVPAGTFPAYRVEMSGGSQDVVFHVSVAAPRRVLKIEPVGTPVSIELVK